MIDPVADVIESFGSVTMVNDHNDVLTVSGQLFDTPCESQDVRLRNVFSLPIERTEKEQDRDADHSREEIDGWVACAPVRHDWHEKTCKEYDYPWYGQRRDNSISPEILPKQMFLGLAQLACAIEF